MKGIIVCADDFALHAGVSMGIVRLAQLKRISATSAMVLSPGWKHEAMLLHHLRGHIDVGLHLDWTSPFAVSAGHGVSLVSAMRRSVLGGFHREQARTVIARQLDLFETHWQATPDYIDGHQHVQQFAGIREALVDELTCRYGHLPIKPYLRLSRARSNAGTVNFKGLVMTMMGSLALEKIATNARLSSARDLFGIYNFAGGTKRYAALMARWLAQAPHGSILMCHPSQAADPHDVMAKARMQEFSYMAGREFEQALSTAGVVPTRGQQVIAGVSQE